MFDSSSNSNNNHHKHHKHHQTPVSVLTHSQSRQAAAEVNHTIFRISPIDLNHQPHLQPIRSVYLMSDQTAEEVVVLAFVAIYLQYLHIFVTKVIKGRHLNYTSLANIYYLIR